MWRSVSGSTTTEFYTLSLHDALPIYLHLGETASGKERSALELDHELYGLTFSPDGKSDRKSTRLNSSHTVISYAVFCLKIKETAPQRQYERREVDSARRCGVKAGRAS